ncbi:hypothetical protein [Luteolibacter sp. Populi]|uniref:hypothetical protein n=1 Tax=Luteolibacter sp. Populi TaxID=3230487 RepID=UPI003467D985
MIAPRFGWVAISAAISSAAASDVAFLPDGKYLVRCEGEVLKVKDTDDDFPESELKLPDELRTGVAALACTTEGLLAVAGKSGAMTWNPASKEWKPLWHAPDSQGICDMACDPKSGGIVFLTVAEGERPDDKPVWHFLPKGAAEAGKVFNRRAPGPVAPSFDVEGNLYFICYGDVWKGGFDRGDSPENAVILRGKRMWPIADLETGSSNRDGALAEGVVALGGRLLVHLDYSHSSGGMVRVPNVDPYKEGLPIKWEELLGDGGSAPLALAPDGKMAAAYVSQDKRWWVFREPDNEPEPLSIDGHAK